MDSEAKQISNPFSTGGGGGNFEVQVQASFVALMLTEGFVPCLPCQPVQKIKLQGRHADYDTDDLIVFTASENGSEERKLLGQIKHSIAMTAKDPVFGEVISAAWSDFNNTKVFTKGKDAIALITGPLSATDIADVRFLLERSRFCESPQEFLTDVEKANFSSKPKRAKLKAFRAHLDKANGKAVPDDEFVLFLRHFHLLGYDLDIRSGVMHAVLHSLIGRYSQEEPASVWAQIVQEVSFANQNAGTITRDSVPPDLREAFRKPVVQIMPEAISLVLPPSQVQDWRISEFASSLVVADLLGAWNERSEGDMAIARRLAEVNEPFDAWQSNIRRVLQLPGSPLILRNGMWAVRQRGELWQALGPCVFDKHLELVSESGLTVARERDTEFDLEPQDRFAASIHGQGLSRSKQIRKGLADSLALLGSRPSLLVNCSQHKPEETAVLTVRRILKGADSILWGSLDDLLPALAEASPTEFLCAVANSLSQQPCPFDDLFAQEEFGKNYLTGLLWALESLAWDEQFLVRATMALGALAARDPGGQWANRPANSLTTIFLPWLPQTTATVEKRKVAIQTLSKELPEVAWKILLSLLPDEVRVSGKTRKPTWRKVLPDDWKDGVTQKDYWDQVSIYAEMAAGIARADTPKLQKLVERLEYLPRPIFDELMAYLSSVEIASMSEGERQGIWTTLRELALRHRRSAEAKWALPEGVMSSIEALASRFEPKDVQNLSKRLFCGRDWALFEENGNWEEQEKGLEHCRQEAVKEILRAGGIEAVVRFAESVESPPKVGFSLGAVAEDEADSFVLPSMLNAEDERHQSFAAEFVRAMYLRKGWNWVDATIIATWSKADIGRFLSILPFSQETWARVDTVLSEDASQYWGKVGVYPYQGKGDLRTAIDRLIEHGRPWAAIDCLAKNLHDGLPLDRATAVKALLSAATSSEGHQVYDAIEIIKALQDDPETKQADLFKVECAFRPLLDEHNHASPKLLESLLASDPDFFCEVIRAIYRSDRESDSDVEPTEEKKSAAERAWRLLHKWQVVPGTVGGNEFSGDAFQQWIEAVTKSSTETGHLDVTLQHVGSVLIHCPSDPGGLWMHHAVADVLNRPDFEEMRKGLSMAIHNSRGVHWVDPTGAPEKELATKYKRQSEEIENAGYYRIAAVLRTVAESYEREAQQTIAEYQADTE